MGRKLIKEQRRNEIQNALYRCLLKKSFSETSMKDIGKEASINPALLHYYFKSKEDLLLHFIDYINKHYLEAFDTYTRDLRKRGSNYREFLWEGFNFMNTQITTDKKFQSIFLGIWEIALFNPQVNARIKKIYDDWIREIVKIIRSGGHDPVRALRMAMAIVAFQEGMGLLMIFLNLKKNDIIPIMKDFQEKIIEML